MCLDRMQTSKYVKKGCLTSCLQLCTPLCKTPRDLGSRQRSAYQLIPGVRGARAQWNFTDQMVNPMLGFSELAWTCSHSPPLAYISLGHHWPVVGQVSRVGEELQAVHQVNSRSETFAIICRASMKEWVFRCCMCNVAGLFHISVYNICMFM